MTKYLISFPSGAMDVRPEEMAAVGDAAHAVVHRARAAGVWVFGGAIDEDVATVMVDADRSVVEDTYPQTRELAGGYCILELPSHDEAVEWAARLAAACRCPQEVRAFRDDPDS